jgi:putative ABC transport system ATP-binding protein
VVECRALSKRFHTGGRELVVLDGIDLAVGAGEFVAVLGPSGSGKSTLLGCLAGLDRPTSGTVALDGEEIQDRSEDELALLRRRIGFVFQSFQLLANYTALENVLLSLELAGREHPGAEAERWLTAVGLGARLRHLPSQLSGGEQQRVALARAFATRPKLLFADEPTGSLDADSGRAALELFDQLRRENGTTVVLITHDAQIAALAQRRVVLRAGRIVSDEGAPRPPAAAEARAPAAEADVTRADARRTRAP